MPLTADQVGVAQPQRFLYLFGCTAEGCGRELGCWRALRLTVPTATSAAAGNGTNSSSTSSSIRRSAPPAAPSSGAPADDWGLGSGAADGWGAGGGDSWGSADPVAAAGGSAFDFGDLNAALEAAGSAGPGQLPPPPKMGRGGEPGSSGSASAHGASAPAYDAARPSLPAFHLYAQPESQCGASGGGNTAGGGGAA